MLTTPNRTLNPKPSNKNSQGLDLRTPLPTVLVAFVHVYSLLISGPESTKRSEQLWGTLWGLQYGFEGLSLNPKPLGFEGLGKAKKGLE